MSLESKAIPPQLPHHHHAEACSVQLHTVYTYRQEKVWSTVACARRCVYFYSQGNDIGLTAPRYVLSSNSFSFFCSSIAIHILKLQHTQHEISHNVFRVSCTGVRDMAIFGILLRRDRQSHARCRVERSLNAASLGSWITINSRSPQSN